MTKSYEIIEHTADIGIRAFGKDLCEVYANAALGMLSLMVSHAAPGQIKQQHVTVQGQDPADLLVAWLQEILFYFYAQQQVFTGVKVLAVDDSTLSAILTCEPFDLERHELLSEVKAATYHAIRVDREGEGWVAEVFLDV